MIKRFLGGLVVNCCILSTFGQTDVPCRFFMQNFSKEPLVYSEISVRDHDQSQQSIPGAWTYAAGKAGFISDRNNTHVTGCQIYYTITN